MSSLAVSEDTTEKATLKSAMHDYWLRIKAGDIGSLPAVLGLVALCIVFGSMSSVFLTPGNFANLLTQAAAVIVIASAGQATAHKPQAVQRSFPCSSRFNTC